LQSHFISFAVWESQNSADEAKLEISMHFSTRCLTAGGLFLAVLLSSAGAQKTQPPEATKLIDSIRGPVLYTAYCAVCHGQDGKGGGPMAKSLRVPPPDLTRIAIRAGGKFPLARIQRIVSGE
jgi:cytochrome c553